MPAPAWYYVVWCGGSLRKLGDFVEDQQSRAGAIQQVQDTRTTTTSGNYDLVSGIAGGPTRQGAVPRACRQVEDTQATNNDDGNDGGDGGMPFFENVRSTKAKGAKGLSGVFAGQTHPSFFFSLDCGKCFVWGHGQGGLAQRLLLAS